jgi:hypothetical protein
MQKPPRVILNLTHAPSRIGTVTAAEKRAARLTGGDLALMRCPERSRRLRWSNRCVGQRRRWPESVGPRAQAGEFVGGECSGLLTRNSSIGWLGEIYQVTQRQYARGI